MNAVLILDNSTTVPANVAGIFGLDSFADLIIRKRSIRQRLSALSATLIWGEVITLDGGPIRPNIAHRLERLAKGGSVAIYLPSYVHLAAGDDEACAFFEKLSYSTQSISVTNVSTDQGGAPPYPEEASVLVLQGADLLSFLNAPSADARQTDMQQLVPGIPQVPADFPLLDLRDTEDFLLAVTSTFDARHFNRVSSTDRYTITKHSTNAEKLKNEFEFFSWIPPQMRRFFIEPFQFEQDPRGASYRMERLLVPDFALQWLHNSVRITDFEQFMKHLFYFLEERQSRSCPESHGKATAESLFVTKVVERLAMLQAQPGFDAVSMHMERAFGGLDVLQERYLSLYKRLSPLRRYDRIAIIHGDLCFSNILYNGALGTLKLIDPRGASSPDDLFSDPWYDLAKLSHSIEGLYDYINAGKFSVQLDTSGTPTLQLDAPARSAEARVFRSHCKAFGMSSRLVRLYEASLFISMTPLHIESPLKVLAFLLNANNILDLVADDTAWER